MTKIKLGDAHDDSVIYSEIVSDGGESEVEHGTLYDRAHLSSRIFDLKHSSDLNLIAKELTSLAKTIQDSPDGQAHSDDVAALNQAAKHVAAGDEAATKKCLTRVGKWILSTATAIGTPLAVEFLKSYLP